MSHGRSVIFYWWNQPKKRVLKFRTSNRRYMLHLCYLLVLVTITWEMRSGVLQWTLDPNWLIKPSHDQWGLCHLYMTLYHVVHEHQRWHCPEDFTVTILWLVVFIYIIFGSCISNDDSTVMPVKLFKDESTERSRGFAFVQYTCQDDAMLAIENLDRKVIFLILGLFIHYSKLPVWLIINMFP